MKWNPNMPMPVLGIVPEAPAPVDEESLIADQRGDVSTAQRVEQKMMEAMRTGPIMLSHLQSFERPHGR